MKLRTLNILLPAMLIIGLMTNVALGGDFNAQSTSGIKLTNDEFVPENSLIQLIWAGPDGQINEPNSNPGNVGQPTGDDVLIAPARVGDGYLPGWANGCFDKVFSGEHIQVGNVVYLRVWNTANAAPMMSTLYGDSNPYEIQSAQINETHDFGTFFVNSAMGSGSTGGSIVVKSSSGVVVPSGGSSMFVPTGCRVELIFAGPDSAISPPDANTTDVNSLGAPTGDDVLIGSTTIGTGVTGSANGRFAQLFSDGSIQVGNWIYIRIWDTDQTPTLDSNFGDSNLYQVKTATNEETYDVGTYSLDTQLDQVTVPVELASFSVESVAGRVLISWSTMSESENLGFHIYKSTTPKGDRIRVNETLIKGAINSETRNDYKYEERVTEPDQEYYYWLADVATDGTMEYHGPQRIVTKAAPKSYGLDTNFPNPFNPTTAITFKVKEAGNVSLNVYNLRGQRIRSLVNASREAGEYTVTWDGKNENGESVTSGMYFYVLQVNGFRATKKMTLLK